MVWKSTQQEVWWDGKGSCGSCGKKRQTLNQTEQSTGVARPKNTANNAAKPKSAPMYVTGKVTNTH